jgi:hypothetical protein
MVSSGIIKPPGAALRSADRGDLAPHVNNNRLDMIHATISDIQTATNIPATPLTSYLPPLTIV